MKLSLIVAVAENDVIGGGNSLLWKLPADMRHFRELTTGHPVIMGRKTFDSIGHPLPKRQNIVVTRQKGLSLPHCNVVASLDDAVTLARGSGAEEAFVIGGGQIYLESLPLADRIYFTRVHASFEGDVFFPKLSFQEWRETSRERREPDGENSYAYTFLVYDRIRG